jgi:CII-binding regulator of phage lambda lysogenization HflD
MMDVDIVKFMTEHSVMMAIAAFFLWQSYQLSRTIAPLLTELQNSSKLQTASLESLNSSLATIKQSCDNTTMALTLIGNTLSTTSSTLERHDKRAEFMNTDIREVVALVRRRPCMAHDAHDAHGEQTRNVMEV